MCGKKDGPTPVKTHGTLLPPPQPAEVQASNGGPKPQSSVPYSFMVTSLPFCFSNLLFHRHSWCECIFLLLCMLQPVEVQVGLGLILSHVFAQKQKRKMPELMINFIICQSQLKTIQKYSIFMPYFFYGCKTVRDIKF